jgi:hypothetical protein
MCWTSARGGSSAWVRYAIRSSALGFGHACLDGRADAACWGLTGAFALVALATFVFAREGRREAVEMESYWFPGPG